ncbi:MAG: 50S ribosomal protein L30 [Rickettsiales bacterium]|nr:50S ribosomal protein L30 [Rickettsiales bacterium]
MANIKVKQVKSSIGVRETQIKVLRALGLGKLGKSKELPATDSVLGMVAKVKHLIKVEG